VADVVIESVAEDRETKRRVLATIGENAKEGALIGSNSSTLPSSFFADVVPDPSRLLNIHFFNPALMMPLVEVVKGKHTSEASVQRALDFSRSIGKTPVRVEKESYGFIVNRILFIAMREAFTLVEDGYVSMEDCDDAVQRALGWPMGPFALGDLIGLDVTDAILTEGAAQTGEDRWSPPRILRERVERGDLGHKTGAGFYAKD
jgi:3-hydroxybutyryl-CoA dehydrogenase